MASIDLLDWEIPAVAPSPQQQLATYRLPPSGAEPTELPLALSTMPRQFAGAKLLGHLPTAQQHAAALAARFGIVPSGPQPQGSAFATTTLVPVRTAARILAPAPAAPAHFSAFGAVPDFVFSGAGLDSTAAPGPRRPSDTSDPYASAAGAPRGPVPIFRSFPGAPPAAGGIPSSYPYSEVTFPRLDRGGGLGSSAPGAGAAAMPQASGQAELDNLWLTGFIDHEHSTHAAAQERDFGEYERRFNIAPPKADPNIMPESTSADATSSSSSSSSSASLPAGSKATAASGVSDRGPMVVGGAGAAAGTSFLSGAEIARLRELQLQLLTADDERKQQQQQARASGAPLPQAVRLESSAYLKENAKIRRVLSLRGEAGQRKLQRFFKPAPKSMRSSAMDNLLFLERLETQAAIVLQRAYRRHLRSVFWRNFLRDTRAATRIQSAFRGMRGRRKSRGHKEQREKLALKMQALRRGKATRERQMQEAAFERDAASDVQRTFRGWFFREKARRRVRKKAARLIQKVWRGLKGRAKADGRFLDRCACLLQRAARTFLARKAYMMRFKLESEAATKLQVIFRGWRVRAQLNEWLRERDAEARKSWMAIMKAEEIFADNEVAKMAKKRAKSDLDGRIKVMEAEWMQAQKLLIDKEFDYVMLMNERIKLSPRAIEQGWNKQLDADVKEHRDWVTNLKASALFKVARPLRELLAQRTEMADRHADLVADRRRLTERWAQQRADLWTRENEYKFGRKKFELVRETAAVKRKWAVRYFTQAGKVDLSRRIGFPLKLEDFAHAESRSMTIAHGSVLELTRSSDAAADPEVADNQRRDARLRLEFAMQSRLREEAARLNALAGGLSGHNRAKLDVNFPPLLADGETAILLADGSVAIGRATAEEAGRDDGRGSADGGLDPGGGGSGGGGDGGGGGGEFGLGTPLAGPLERVPLPASPMGTGRGGFFTFAGKSASTAASASELLDRSGQPSAAGAAVASSSPLSLVGTMAPGNLEGALSLELTPMVETKDGTGEAGEPTAATAAEAAPVAPVMLRTAFGLIPEGKRGKVQTVGKHYGDDFGSALSDIRPTVGGSDEGVVSRSNDGAAEREQRLREKLRDRVRHGGGSRWMPLHERVWETTISRYAGVGVTETGDAKSRQRTDVATHVEEARERYSREAARGDGSAQAALALAQGREGASDLGSTDLETYRTQQSSQRSEGGQALALALAQGQGRQGQDEALDRDAAHRRLAVLPTYVLDEKNRAAEVAAQGMPDAMRASMEQLRQRQADTEAVARLVPGLAGARAGAAMAEVARARATGTVGRSGVSTTREDRLVPQRAEQAEMDRRGDHIHLLGAKIAAVSAQAELMQYGALAKPLLDGMATMQAHLLAADGTAEVLSKAAEMRARKEAERHERLEARKRALNEQRVSGGAGPDDGGGSLPVPRMLEAEQPAPTPLPQVQPQPQPQPRPAPAPARRATALLTETFQQTAGLAATQLSLVGTLPLRVQSKPPRSGGGSSSRGSGGGDRGGKGSERGGGTPAVAHGIALAELRKGAESADRKGGEGPEPGDRGSASRQAPPEMTPEQRKQANFDKSVALLKQSQARGRAQAAVLEINAQLRGVPVSDLWLEYDAGGTGITEGATGAYAWNLPKQLQAETEHLRLLETRALPTTFKAAAAAAAPEPALAARAAAPIAAAAAAARAAVPVKEASKSKPPRQPGR